MRIIALRSSGVTIEDDQGHQSDVIQEMAFTIRPASDGSTGSVMSYDPTGKWRCLRCGRVRCEHARFVQAENPRLPDPPPVDWERYADLLK